MKVILRCLVLGGLIASFAAPAGSLFVRPTTVVLAKKETTQAITISNRGTTPMTAQVRVFAWSQDENGDVLKPTSIVAASPPMLKIAAGQSQTVRLVRRAKQPAVKEETYRLLVDEIGGELASTTNTGVVIQLQYSVPVFVLPNPDIKAKVNLSASVDNESLVLAAVNKSAAHAQVSQIQLAYADGSAITVGSGLMGYVLPDKSRQWSFDLPPDATRRQPTAVRALINGEELQIQL